MQFVTAPTDGSTHWFIGNNPFLMAGREFIPGFLHSFLDNVSHSSDL
ncbi:MAG: hypothetical protein NT075_00860 [Chloroflexi bacterium]|nr:hypothetical protein [Chloroflexota bacterium]